MTWSERTSVFAFLWSALILLIVAGPLSGTAAAVTVTDCTAAGPAVAKGKTTVLDVRPDDLVLQCALTPLPGTERIQVRANSITIDGPAGSIASPFKGRSIDVRADADIVVTNSVLDAANGNARLRLRSETGINVTGSILTAGDITRPGRELRVECRDTGCPINLASSTLLAARVRVFAQGDITGDATIVQTASPRDRITVRSFGGSVVFCNVDLLGDVEGHMLVQAAIDVDLTGSELSIGRNITVIAGTGNVLLTGATLRNDFGKRGEIVVEANGGAGQVEIGNATLIDDDKSASDNDVSEINGREETPHEGNNNTVGTPNLDT